MLRHACAWSPLGSAGDRQQEALYQSRWCRCVPGERRLVACGLPACGTSARVAGEVCKKSANHLCPEQPGHSFYSEPVEGGFTAWCLVLGGGVAARLPDLQLPRPLWSKSWSDSMIRELERRGERRLPKSTCHRARCCCSSAPHELDTRRSFELRRRVGMGQRHPGAHRYAPSCQIAYAMPQLLRRARTWRWLSAVIILAESCLCGRWI